MPRPRRRGQRRQHLRTMPDFYVDALDKAPIIGRDDLPPYLPSKMASAAAHRRLRFAITY